MRDRSNMQSPLRGAMTHGASSLLIIFAVLCLTVFAILSLNTAQTGRRLSERSANAVYAYYTAECEANDIFAAIVRGDIPDSAELRGDCYTYSVKISDSAHLEVCVYRTEDGYTRDISYVSDIEWEADGSLDLWDGEVW